MPPRHAHATALLLRGIQETQCRHPHARSCCHPIQRTMSWPQLDQQGLALAGTGHSAAVAKWVHDDKSGPTGLWENAAARPAGAQDVRQGSHAGAMSRVAVCKLQIGDVERSKPLRAQHSGAALAACATGARLHGKTPGRGARRLATIAAPMDRATTTAGIATPLMSGATRTRGSSVVRRLMKSVPRGPGACPKAACAILFGFGHCRCSGRPRRSRPSPGWRRRELP